MEISSLAVYWQPQERVFYSELDYQEDSVKDIQFRAKIARFVVGSALKSF